MEQGEGRANIMKQYNHLVVEAREVTEITKTCDIARIRIVAVIEVFEIVACISTGSITRCARATGAAAACAVGVLDRVSVVLYVATFRIACTACARITS